MIQAPELSDLSDEDLLALVQAGVKREQIDRQEWQLLYYKPVSAQAMKVHLSTATILGIGGGNRCLPLSSPVLMADGTWKPLSNVQVGDMVIGTDEQGQHAYPVPVVQVFRSGMQEVLKFTCRDDTSFSVTAEHSVPLFVGSGWKQKAKKRRIGDYIERIRETGSSTKKNRHRISAVQPRDITYQYTGDLPLDPYLLGVLIGDGSLGQMSLKFSCADTAVLERVRALLAKVGCQLTYYAQYDYGVVPIDKSIPNRSHAYCNPMRDAIKSLGLWGCHSHQKFIPEVVFGLSRHDRKRVLEGLIDSDGSHDEYTTGSQQLSEGFERLIHSLGGRTTTCLRTPSHQNGIGRPSYRTYWKLNEPLELSCAYKQQISPREINYQRRVLRSVESCGMQECGDIQVDHPGHCYVTEGYTIVSNSGKTETNLVEASIMMTGMIPDALKPYYPREKLRGPCNVRVVCESITTTLAPVILHKLNYQNWSGVGERGGEQGHWGWIPKACLLNEDWDRSWKEAKRTLTVYYRNPDDPDQILGESTLQIMCLRGDQRVLMADGTWRVIRDIQEGDMVHNPDGPPSRVAKTYQYEKAPLTTVKCRGGRRVVATQNHRHYLADGSLRRTDELRIGDKLEALHYRPSESMVFDPALPDWKLGWLGILLGDGYIKGKQAEFTAVGDDSRVLNNLPPMPPNCGLNKANKKGRWRVTLLHTRRDNPLVMFIKELGLWGLGSKEKFVPSFMFRQPPQAVRYFLKHIWNCDGSIQVSKNKAATYTSISRQLAYDVKYLLWGLGIDAAITEGEARCGFTGKLVYRYIVQIYGSFFDRFLAMITGAEYESIEGQTRGGCGTIYALEEAEPDEVYCLTVENPRHAFVVDGLVTHNSHDQEPAKFASGEFHFVMMDEPPKYAIFKENRARIMSVGGRLHLGMTWPTDPGFPVDWIFEEVYDKGRPGPNKDPNVEWIELVTTENPNIDQASVAELAAAMSDVEKSARIEGKPIRFSNLIHALFTNTDTWWCFRCHQSVMVLNGCCAHVRKGETLPCGSRDICSYNHVQQFHIDRQWPAVFIIDPHPRKPHMMMWVTVDGNDDYSVVRTCEIDEEPMLVWEKIQAIEREMGLQVGKRIGDRNMLLSAASSKRQENNWQDEFRAVGLVIDLGDPSDVGRVRVNEYLKPDPQTKRPRLRFHQDCTPAIYQMQRFCWDDYKEGLQDSRDLKQVPKRKHDDYPAMLRYLMNDLPLCATLLHGWEVVSHGKPKGGY